MTERQLKYRDNRLKGMSKKSAAIAAGYSYKTATRKGKQLDKVVNMSELFEMAGLTDKCIVDKIHEGINATKPISAIIYGKDADNKTQDFIEVPDWTARHKFMELMLKLTEKIDNKALVDQSQHTHFTIVSPISENKTKSKFDEVMNGTDNRV